MSLAFTLDFLIVGGMKCGTSSLGFHLGRHPQVAIPKGEVHFFDNDKHYEEGLGWYQSKLAPFITEQTVVVGEKTAAYTYDPKVAERIHRAMPDAKLVWILREPVSRAYSNYIHAYRNGALRLSFAEAVRREPERVKKNIYAGYLARSRYAEQIERFLKRFSRDQMHFMLLENLIADPAETLGNLFTFLGVSEDGFKIIPEPRGPTAMPRCQPLQWAARRLNGNGPLWAAVNYLNLVGKKPGYPPLDEKLKAALERDFEPHNERLAEITGLDLSVWGSTS